MKQIEHTNDERRMLNRVRHPFLVTLWGTWQDSRNLYMVMDFVEGGELFSLLRKSQVRPVAGKETPPHSSLTPHDSDSPTQSPNSTPQKSPSLWSICTNIRSFIVI
jgi:serine/threonine protein kinase